MARAITKANGYVKTGLLYAGIDGFPKRVYKKGNEYFVEHLNKAINVTNKTHRFVGSWN